MATDEQTEAPDEQQQTDDDEQQLTEKPEVTEEHEAKAREMAKAYEDDRPTVALPGSGNTVTGQAVNEWLDDDGKPKHGEVENEVERQT
jgi:hypothetical protein